MLLGRVATAPLSGLVTLLESSVRSYLVGNAGSRPISEAKQPWACLVLRWGTTGEAHVLYSPQINFFQVKNLTWRLYLCIFCTHTLAPLLSSLPQLTSVVRFTSTTTLEQEQHPPHSVLFKTIIIGSISTSLPPPTPPLSPHTHPQTNNTRQATNTRQAKQTGSFQKIYK